ncbi:MAG: hypothetical protein ACI8W8_001707 [Rhodothermales bacterium]|jgi:hypothetical protein
MSKKKRRPFYASCYVDFDEEADEAVFAQNKWFVGLIFLVAFSPLFYFLLFEQERLSCPLWVAQLIAGIILFMGGWMIAHFRRCRFDLGAGRFTYSAGLLVKYCVIHGQTKDIEGIEFGVFESVENRTRSRSQALHFLWKGRRYALAESGAGADPTVAKRLAQALGCPLNGDEDPEDV